MARLLPALLLLLSFGPAYAQRAASEAPAETASPVTVLVFLVLFVGSCAGYVVYIWVQARRRKQQAQE